MSHLNPPAMTWVSVEEQLPDDDTEVLVFTATAYHFLAFVDCGEWKHEDGAPLGDVTHWCELTEPEEQS